MRLPPEVYTQQYPLTFFIPFWQKRETFRILSIDKWRLYQIRTNRQSSCHCFEVLPE